VYQGGINKGILTNVWPSRVESSWALKLWRWRWPVLSKHQEWIIEWHSVTFQNTGILTYIVVLLVCKTSLFPEKAGFQWWFAKNRILYLEERITLHWT